MISGLRHLREFRRHLRPNSSGRGFHISSSCQAPIRVISLFAPDIYFSPYTCRNMDNFVPNCNINILRFSTVSGILHKPIPDVDILSFIRSTLDKLEGPSHCWLNRGDITKDFSKRDEVFLVVTGALIEDFESARDSTMMFEKVKLLQQRYPSLNVIGFQSSRSLSSDILRTHLLRTTMSEYITFPILVTNRTLSEISDGMGYIIFKSLEGQPLVYDKDADFEILDTVLKELNVQQTEEPDLSHNLRGSWVKPLDIIKEPYLSSTLRNLLLYFPGCIEVDEVNNRLFLSDINHHRIIVFDGDGKILDCIGSSPGFEDGEFESSKIMRPAASFYHDEENCLYFVDSENHAIRRADMERRVVETFYPNLNGHSTDTSPWSWFMDKLWRKRDIPSEPEEFDSKSFVYPWHLMKSSENNLFIFNRSFEALWIMELSSGLIKEVVKGSPKILEICGHMILEKSSILKQIPSDCLPQDIASGFSLEGISYAGLISSVATFQDNIVICDPVGQMVLKYSKASGLVTTFQFSKFGMLGLPYWLLCPLESVYAIGFGLPGPRIDHIQRFRLLPGRVDIQMNIDIPENTELVEPLEESCIWRQTRGTAAEISGAESKAESSDKVGVAQKWYDELDDLASLTEVELNTVEESNADLALQDGKVCINCSVRTSPGTSEVIIYAALYLRAKSSQDPSDEARKQQVVRLADNLNPSRNGHNQADACVQFLLTSKRNPEEHILVRPIHVRLKIDSRDHPKAENSKDIILTESSIEVNVSLK